MLISDWSSDLCSSDLACVALRELPHPVTALILIREDRSDKNRLITFDEISKEKDVANTIYLVRAHKFQAQIGSIMNTFVKHWPEYVIGQIEGAFRALVGADSLNGPLCIIPPNRSETRSEEHTSELQSLMRTWYTVFCLKKKKIPKATKKK